LTYRLRRLSGRRLFDQVDVDGTGEIDQYELKTCMLRLGMKCTDDEIKDMMSEVDVDGSGTVAWPEFLWMMAKFGENVNIESQFTDQKLFELKAAFRMYDADGSGDIDCDELESVLTTLGQKPTKKEVEDMIAVVDADDSGTIDWKEFLYLMNKKYGDESVDNQYQTAFKMFDKEGKGEVLTSDFVEKMLRMSARLSDDAITRDELETIVWQCKFENGDFDHLTFPEFTKLMMSLE